MALMRRERYFVARLDDLDHKPSPDAKFVVEILNNDGPAEVIVYFGHDSNVAVAVVHAMKGRLPVESHVIPEAVLKAARERRIGCGEYVTESGEIVPPSFLPPWAYDAGKKDEGQAS